MKNPIMSMGHTGACGAAPYNRNVMLAFAAFILIAGAASGTVDFLRAARTETLTIIAEDSASPWSYRDGTGYANDIVMAAYAAAKVDVQLGVEPYARCKQKVLNGSAAGCFSMSWVPDLEGKVVFSEAPLFVCNADYLHRMDRPLEASSEQTIRRKIVVGAVLGYEYPPSLARLRERGLIVFEETDSEILNLKKLDAGRIDAALITQNDIKTYQYICAKAGVQHEIRPAFRSGELKSYIGFSVKHPRGQWARDRFNAGFAIIRKNGVLPALNAKWQDITRKESGVAPSKK